jgi:hypothetical protein
MPNDALLLAIAVLTLLLAAFIYQIVTTTVIPVDAPTLAKAASATAPPAPAPPARQRQAPTFPARGSGRPGRAGAVVELAVRPAPWASPPEASRGRRSWGVATLAAVGLAAGITGGWLFLRTAHGAAACSHHAIQVCSQGFVLLTGAQLTGGAIAVAGIVFVVVASVLALR